MREYPMDEPSVLTPGNAGWLIETDCTQYLEEGHKKEVLRSSRTLSRTLLKTCASYS